MKGLQPIYSLMWMGKQGGNFMSFEILVKPACNGRYETSQACHERKGEVKKEEKHAMALCGKI